MKEHSQHTCGTKQSPCGCCAGTEAVTPLAVANRPGLNAIAYRVGAHATFLETMKARLSSLCLGADEDCRKGKGNYPLRKLTTREADDPSLAMLDAWATVADVLTFYQERIANEGYLRTATERRSVLELARLVGYKLRPGVAASVSLALTLEKGTNVVIEPFQVRAQSMPGPGELAQTFENSEKLDARARWNQLLLRMKQPQTAESIRTSNCVYLKGIVKKKDPLLIAIGSATPKFYRVKTLTPEPDKNRTKVTLQQITLPEQVEQSIRSWQVNLGATMSKKMSRELMGTGNSPGLIAHLSNVLSATSEPMLLKYIEDIFLKKAALLITDPEYNSLTPLVNELQTLVDVNKAAVDTPMGISDKDLVNKIAQRPSIQPPFLNLKLENVLRENAGNGLSMVGTFKEALRRKLPIALSKVIEWEITEGDQIGVFALRAHSLFNHRHPGIPITPNGTITGFTPLTLRQAWGIGDKEAPTNTILFTEPADDQPPPFEWVVVKTPKIFETNAQTKVIRVTEYRRITKSAFGNSPEVNALTLGTPWIDNLELFKTNQLLCETIVYIPSEEWSLAEEPITNDVGSQESLELGGFYEELPTGRRVIVSGERILQGEITVPDSELATIATVDHKARRDLPGDTKHTFITFVEPLEYRFKRDTVTIYANVVKATHGETKREVLGSGNGAKALQQFALRQPPLTYVSAPTREGAESTLKIFVNDVRWHEAETIFGLGPTDRRFITRADDDAVTTAVFGNGKQGARLPTGVENIRAEYRQGIGKAGNAAAEKISQLGSKPLGVKGVINPLRASGGADKESRDQARKNAPLAVMALDRLVSTQDYQDFARTFAGVGKAFAKRLSDGRRELVHVTIAGADNIPIDESSDLLRNLRLALRRYGDPAVPIKVDVRELMLLIISANVRIHPDYVWEKVVEKIRAKMLDAFSFENRELGQDALLSEAISVMQSVEGVAYVDVDVFGGGPEKFLDSQNERRLLTPSEIAFVAQEFIAPSEEDDDDPRDSNLLRQLARKISNRVRVRVNLPDFEPNGIRPAQLAFLTPEVRNTLILNLR